MKIDRTSKGILGLGATSTTYCLKEIHSKYQKKNNVYSTFPCLLYQVDFQELNPYLPNQFDMLIPTLKTYLEQISDLGVTHLLIPNITLHETLDQIKTPLEICHAVNLTLKYLVENSIWEVFIFGTLYSMNSDYLRSKFSAKNVKILKPSDSDQNWIEHFRKKVYQQNATLTETENFHHLIEKYTEKNPVIIACTELSVFSAKKNPSCIDMMDLQIEAFLK